MNWQQKLEHKLVFIYTAEAIPALAVFVNIHFKEA